MLRGVSEPPPIDCGKQRSPIVPVVAFMGPAKGEGVDFFIQHFLLARQTNRCFCTAPHLVLKITPKPQREETGGPLRFGVWPRGAAAWGQPASAPCDRATVLVGR